MSRLPVLQDYGRAGDYVPPSVTTATFKRAAEQFTAGGDLYVPAGTYDLDDTVDLGDIHLYGSGERTALRWQGAPGGTMFRANSRYWSFNGFEFLTLPNPGTWPGRYIEHIETARWTRVKDCQFANATDAAIHVSNGWHIPIFDNVQFGHCPIGIRLIASSFNGSNSATVKMRSIGVSDQENPGVFQALVEVVDNIGVDTGILSIDDIDYAFDFEPQPGSAAVLLRQNVATGPFISVRLSDMQVRRVFTPVANHHLINLDKPSGEGVFRFMLENIQMSNGGQTITSIIGGNVPARMQVDKEVFIPYAEFMDHQGHSSFLDDVQFGRKVYGGVGTLDDAAYPDVSGGNLFYTGGTTEIAGFNGGVEGQEIRILSAHAVDIQHNADVRLKGKVNLSLVPEDTLTLIKYGSTWNEF